MSITTVRLQAEVESHLTTKKSAVKSKAVYTLAASFLALGLSACTETTTQERNLSAVVAHYADQKYPEFKHAFINLDNDGVDDAVVLLQGQSWCGSGGCTMLVLQGDGASYRIVSKSTVTREPVRIAESISHGWKDLIVHSDGAEKLLQFDGRAYPANPSMESTAKQEQIDSAHTIFP